MGTQQESLSILKDRVLRRLLTMFALGALVIVAIFLYQGARGGMLRPNAWLHATFALAVVPLRVLHVRIGYRRNARLLVAYLLLVPSYMQLFRGLTPGTVLMQAAALLLAAMLFGRRGAFWSFLLFVASLAFGGFAMTHELFSPWPAGYWDPHEPLVWLRYAVVMLFWGGGLAFALVELVGQLEHYASGLQATLQREREERLGRETAQQALERSQRLDTLAQLAAGMAHDFNNDLMVIANSAELIEVTARNPSVKHHAQVIVATAESGGRTVRQLLTLGRKEPPHPEPVGLRPLLRACQQAIARLLPDDIRLELEVEEDVAVQVDRVRLQQAILNLATNARDAMPDGGVLSLRVERAVVRGEHFVCIVCSDTGAGMDESTKQHVFEPFFSTKPHGRGSGLGLSVAQRTVEEAGGFIELDSEPGRGTTFRIYLPRLHEVDAAAESLSSVVLS